MWRERFNVEYNAKYPCLDLLDHSWSKVACLQCSPTPLSLPFFFLHLPLSFLSLHRRRTRRKRLANWAPTQTHVRRVNTSVSIFLYRSLSCSLARSLSLSLSLALALSLPLSLFPSLSFLLSLTLSLYLFPFSFHYCSFLPTISSTCRGVLVQGEIHSEHNYKYLGIVEFL